MKLKAPTHKAYLQRCFYTESNGRWEEKKFPLAKLTDAASIMKKFTEDADKKSGQFSDKELSFSASETSLLNEMFKEVKEVAASFAAVHLEVQALFDKE